MNKQQMIDAIYKEMADKTLSFGCRVRYKDFSRDDTILGTLFDIHGNVFGIPECNFGCKGAFKSKAGYVVFTDDKTMQEHIKSREEYETKVKSGGHFVLYKNISYGKIIGHPVMIGDVFDWIERNMGFSNQEYNEDITGDVKDVIWKRGPMRKPIEDQSDECICFIFSLIN